MAQPRGGARAAAVSPAAAKLQLEASPLGTGPRAVSCTLLAIHDLDAESIELIFAFLPPEDRRSAAAVCRLWRRIHNSSTRLWGTVLLSGERVLAAAASAAASGSVGSWLAARLEAMRSVRLWSPGAPLESFASSLAALLSRENRVQVRAAAAAAAAGQNASAWCRLAQRRWLCSLLARDPSPRMHACTHMHACYSPAASPTNHPASFFFFLLPPCRRASLTCAGTPACRACWASFSA